MNQENPEQGHEHCEHPHHKPIPLSSSGRAFFKAYAKDYSLFGFIIDVVLRADFVSHVAGEALKITAPDFKPGGNEDPEWEKLTPVDLAKTNPGPATLFLRENRLALLQMNHCRMVDNFTMFLAGIIREALASRPEMLRSNEQIRLDYALSFTSITDLREDLVDRKVSDLGYLGFVALLDWIEDHMGLKLIKDAGIRNTIVELLETRNAIVHNRGRVGEKYLRTVVDPKFKEGELRSMEADDYQKCCQTIAETVKQIDSAVSKKFGLQTEQYPKGQGQAGA